MIAVDPDPLYFAISSRKHLGKALRQLGLGIEQGHLPVSERVYELVKQLADELIPPSPAPDAPPTTTEPPA